jgi:Cu+-exporting ATPase
VALGNAAMMDEAGADIPAALRKKAEALSADAKTAMFIAEDGKVLGIVAVADPIKETAKDSLAKLRDDGIEIIMATGDARATAEAVAGKLGIDRIEAGVSPEGKHDLVVSLRKQGRSVAMAGDGVNDAIALAAADVGVAMGTGADVAMESAGITLMKGDLRAIIRARRLAHGTLNNIRQNLVFAFGYNAIGVPIAAGVLFPFFGLLLSPIIAAAAMSLSSVSVITNSLRLRGIKL